MAIALLLGAVAAFIAARWMNASRPASSQSAPRVVVVERAVEAGRAIAADQVASIEWPGSSIPKDALSSTDEVVGRIARVSMIPGEPVLPGKLAPLSATGGLSSIIPDGKRAITVRVNEVIAVAGFALPGSYVDVLVSGKDADKNSFSRTVLSRVKVLAVAQETSAEPDKPKVVNAVTLELSPFESEKLDLARSIGRLSLVLRNELDTGEVNSRGVRLADIVYPYGPFAAARASGLPPLLPSHPGDGPEEIRGISRKQAEPAP